MSKRKSVSFNEDDSKFSKRTKNVENAKKHSLDSDEEDTNDDEDNVLDDNDIEGEEDGEMGDVDGVRMTAFNMREELEEGYFDRDGHFLWKKDNDIHDNWLDNIDWQQIKPKTKATKELKSLGDDSDSENETEQFNVIDCYKKIIQYVEPGESIQKALRRLGGGNKKLSSVERLKRKKAGILDENNVKITQLTELANDLLNQTGNMDIYQETYEQITFKIQQSESKCQKSTTVDDELDMYSENFDVNEKKRLNTGPGPSTEPEIDTKSPELMWEFKWTQTSEEIQGPNTTEEMQKFVIDGKFKDGVWVRRCGQAQFYSSRRIDFELYLS